MKRVLLLLGTIVALSFVAALWRDVSDGRSPEGPVARAAATEDAAASAAAKVPARGRAAPEQGGIPLRVLDENGEPVGRALVEVAYGPGRQERLTSDARGEVRLEGSAAVRVHAEGFLGACTWIDADEAGAAELPLERAGAILLRFETRLGEPYANVGARLLLPEDLRGGVGAAGRGAFEAATAAGFERARERLIAAGRVRLWKVVADARGGEDGGLAWAGLPPSAGYRYRLAARFVAPLPPFEEPVVAGDPGGGARASARSLGSSGTSGPIAVGPGETVHLTLVVEPPAGLSGRLVDELGRPLVGARVRVLHTAVFGAPGAATTAHTANEAVTTSGAQGAFAFAELRAGSKLLMARCALERDGLARCYLASRRLELVEGEHLDLGALAVAGDTLRLALRFELESGAPLAHDELFDSPAGARAELTIAATRGPATPSAGLREATLFESLELPLDGTPVVLHGLRWRLYALRLDPVGLPEVAPPYELQRDALVEERIDPALGSATIVVPVRDLRSRPEPLELLVRGPAEPALLFLRGVLRRASGSLHAFEASMQNGSARLALPEVGAGEHELWLSAIDPADPGGAGACYRGRFALGGPGTHELEARLEPAVVVQGRVAAGGRRALRFTPPELTEASTWLHSIRPQGDGRFAVGGVLPSSELVASPGGQRIRVGTTGAFDIWMEE